MCMNGCQQTAPRLKKVGHFRLPHSHDVQLTRVSILEPVVLSKHVAGDLY
jgi:hypothetical protein